MSAFDPSFGNGRELELGSPELQGGHLREVALAAREESHLLRHDRARLKQERYQLVDGGPGCQLFVQQQTAAGTRSSDAHVVVTDAEQAPWQLKPIRPPQLQAQVRVLPSACEVAEDDAAIGRLQATEGLMEQKTPIGPCQQAAHDLDVLPCRALGGPQASHRALVYAEILHQRPPSLPPRQAFEMKSMWVAAAALTPTSEQFEDLADEVNRRTVAPKQIRGQCKIHHLDVDTELVVVFSALLHLLITMQEGGLAPIIPQDLLDEQQLAHSVPKMLPQHPS